MTAQFCSTYPVQSDGIQSVEWFGLWGKASSTGRKRNRLKLDPVVRDGIPQTQERGEGVREKHRGKIKPKRNRQGLKIKTCIKKLSLKNRQVPVPLQCSRKYLTFHMPGSSYRRSVTSFEDHKPNHTSVYQFSVCTILKQIALKAISVDDVHFKIPKDRIL